MRFPETTMQEALEAVVTKPLEKKLSAILWTLDNDQAEEIKELKKKLAEKEEKGAKEMDAVGVQLAGVSQKVQDLLQKVEDVLAKKPNL